MAEHVFRATRAGRLDQILAEGVADLSRRAARRLIEGGAVFVDGRRVRRLAFEVAAGARLVVHRAPAPASPELPVLFADDAIVAIDKPPGIHVNETESTARGSVVSALRPRFGALFVVHRLDLETSGVLVLARTEAEAARWSAAFAERRVEKRYLALTAGAPPEGTVELAIDRDPKRPRARRVVSAGGQSAVTAVRVLGRAGELALVEARPSTGRTHQIRVHLAALGAPVFGDSLYGGPSAARVGDEVVEAERVMLHAAALRFAELELAAPVPGDFRRSAGHGLAPLAEGS